LKNHVLPFDQLLLEDLDPDAEKLRDLNLLPKQSIYKKIGDFVRGFERDDAINAAITAFDDAVTEYVDKHFTAEDKKAKEYYDAFRRMRNDANDIDASIRLADRTWLDWWATH
jgi:hypothetical protein